MSVLQGKCHCGAVEFQVDTPKGLHGLRRCDCSICRRKGAVMATAPLADLTITKGEDKLSLYQWNTKVAKHYFCSICGIYTHHQRRSNPNEFGFNVGCLENIDPDEIGIVEQTDGKLSSLVQ